VILYNLIIFIRYSAMLFHCQNQCMHIWRR